jgi:hypothetical protein
MTKHAMLRWKHQLCNINYLKLSGNYMYRQFQHHRFMQSARTKKTAFVSSNNIKWLVFVMQMGCVFCEV